MRSTKLAIPLALVALGLIILVVARAARHREAPRRPALPVARDAGPALDAGPDVADASDDDGGGDDARRDAAVDVDPRQQALEDQRRDLVAARVLRDLAQRGRGVSSVRATSSGGVARDNLRMQGSRCSDGFNREVARTYELGTAGFTLVTCVQTGSRDTFLTGVPQEPTPVPDAGPRPRRPAR